MTNGPEEFTIDNVIEQTTMKGKRTRLACPKRAGGWCEPAEARVCTGPGVFRLNRAERIAPRYRRA